MQTDRLRVRIILTLLFLGLMGTAWPVPAQVIDSVTAVETDDPLAQVLAEGARLEQENRWADAVNHYEQATRTFPRQRQLEQRLELARIHYDLARRYADPTYVRMLPKLSPAQALEVFAEVCGKIQTHYVEPPDWDRALGQGTRALEVALQDSSFVQAHHVQTSRRQMDTALSQVRQVLNQRTIQHRGQAREMVDWIAQIMSHYLAVPQVATIMEYAAGATGALDSYSAYLTQGQLDEVYSQIEGNFVGLGVELKGDDGYLLIADVIADGPADRAGIRGGEKIIEVDGQSTRGLSIDQAADLLKGPEGSYVQVTVLADSGFARRLAIQRQRVEIPSVEDVRISDPKQGIAYLRITSFQKTTSRDMDRALWKLHRQGMRILIIDLRGNPGGLLTESVEVADRFVMEGTIVSTRGRSPGEDYTYRAHREGTWRVPLVVLIDADSASASEIFAAAIRDHGRGTVVGTRTYGKGSVQGIFPLGLIQGGIRLTTAHFYSPTGRPISGQGVQPDVPVRVAAKPVVDAAAALPDPSADPILQMGLKMAQQMLAKRHQAAYLSASPN